MRSPEDGGLCHPNNRVQYKRPEGFPNYLVGDDGSVWSNFVVGGQGAVTDRWRRLRPGRLHHGHVKVTLCKSGEKFSIQVHQLVMLCFVGKPPDGMEVRHLNGNPRDNRLSNLTYGTPLENAADRSAHGTQTSGERHHRAKLTDEQVGIIRSRLSSGEKARVIAEDFGVSRSCISMIACGQNWNQSKESVNAVA